MPEREPFEYVVLRVVPRVERGEFINAGVVLICRSRAFLAARVGFDRERLRCLAPFLDEEMVEEAVRLLELVPRIAAGEPSAGPIAKLDYRERWHWLAAPSSTILQTSPAHTGLCADPERELNDVFDEMVKVH